MQSSKLQTGELRRRLLACAAVGVLAANSIAPAFAGEVKAGVVATTVKEANDGATASPIKHVIVIIGENRSFDHVFATYTPKPKNEKVLNLLSEGVVKADGTPGANYNKAIQYSAEDYDVYEIAPQKSAYATLPPVLAGGPKTPYVCEGLSLATNSGDVTSCNDAAGNNAKTALLSGLENGLEQADYYRLLTGGTGQKSGVPDARITYDGKTPTTLPPGPYQLTSAANPYDFYAASPVHRFMQMQQQLDCKAANAKKGESFGCASDLYPWVEATVGAGSDGAAPPSSFAQTVSGEGAASMGFYNMAQGDAPYFKTLADTYAMSDNYHQAVKGGTGANHIMIGTADAIYFSDGNGTAQTPPSNPVNPITPGTPIIGFTSALNEVENPNPYPGSNNWYIADGYGSGSNSNYVYGAYNDVAPNANYGGGSYVNCSDEAQPGVGPQLEYMSSLPNPVHPKCAPDHYYLVNNYNPGYFGDGSNAFTDHNDNNTVFTVPPSSVRTIGDALLAKKVSWAYYGDQFDIYLNDKYDLLYGATDDYCNICNWVQYSTSLMTNPNKSNYLKDTKDLYTAIANYKGQSAAEDTLPAVSYVKPSGIVDGHPASSKLELFEAFTKKIVDAVQGNAALAKNTAIFITFDEGGGYWDSGYVQPVDFFGDGTRIPMIVVSPFSKGGRISHTYNDHVSITKFIERNWGMKPITARSRDNLPNPLTAANPYVPVNSPAIGDLWDLFTFD